MFERVGAAHDHPVVAAPHLEPDLPGLAVGEHPLEVRLLLVPARTRDLEMVWIHPGHLRHLGGVGGADLDLPGEKGVVAQRLADEPVPPGPQHRASRSPPTGYISAGIRRTAESIAASVSERLQRGRDRVPGGAVQPDQEPPVDLPRVPVEPDVAGVLVARR